MIFISVTRLRVRSLRYLLQFVWQALKTARQAERAPGFLKGRLARDAKNVFWTVTAWETETAMKAYRDSGAHKGAMPKLLDWCDEASIAHWQQEDRELPNWQEAHRHMVVEGRMSKVRYPSAAQAAKQITAPTISGNSGRALKPLPH
jgi:heme-degrading monooxygenase HmoA